METESNPMELWLKKFPPPGESDKDRNPPGEISVPRGLPRRELKKMKPEAVLDLHGMIREDAEARLTDFLLDSRRRGLRKVLIIHGKGTHSAGKPVLPEAVRRVLERNPYVGEFGSADPGSGGRGALWVIVRQRSR